MIYSPLEQFNILSLYDFSIANLSNYEMLSIRVANLVWFICEIPANMFSYISIGSDAFGMFFIKDVIYQTYLIVFGALNIFFGVLRIISQISLKIITTTNITSVFTLPDTIFNSLLHLWSYIWESFYTNLNILYITNRSVPAAIIPAWESNASFLNDANISLITSSFGIFLTNTCFIIEELFLIITSTIYNYTLEILFNLTKKDFSYLIVSLNTSTIWVLFAFLFLIFILSTILRSITIFPKNNWQSILESMYSVVLDIVNENAGPKGLKHFPLIFTTFIIILTCNLFGMIPYSFTVTSHLIITFSMALAIFIGINILGILKNRFHFLSLFFPPGTPLVLAPLLVMIELVSYVFRVLSLSIRLFANLMSGHTLLKILSTFAWLSVSFWGLFVIPIGIIFLITGLEIGIACLQAYIFSVLLCIYINDAFNLH